jgi:hypothetical protein
VFSFQLEFGAAKVFDYFCIYFRLLIMNTELDFGDLDDEADLALPTEAEIQSILHERNGVGGEQKKKRRRFQEVLECNLQELPSAWQGEEKDWLRKRLDECKAKRLKKVAIDCRNICMMPAGTFSIFHEMAEEGMEIYLLNPSDAVKSWLWFRAFAKDCGGECFRICKDPIVSYAGIAQAGIFRGTEEDDE